MARDDKFFNCNQEYEDRYVAGLYGSNEDEVSRFLFSKCSDNTIKYSTHMEVYTLIKNELGYAIPN